MLKPFLEVSKLHIGACGTLWRIWRSHGVHAGGNKSIYHHTVGSARLGSDLVSPLYLVVGLAEHAAPV